MQSYTPVTPASIMNLGRLGIDSSLAPPPASSSSLSMPLTSPTTSSSVNAGTSSGGGGGRATRSSSRAKKQGQGGGQGGQGGQGGSLVSPSLKPILPGAYTLPSLSLYDSTPTLMTQRPLPPLPPLSPSSYSRVPSLTILRVHSRHPQLRPQRSIHGCRCRRRRHGQVNGGGCIVRSFHS